MSRRKIPEINAGSMADIAFLLLIFFLVTTTMDIDVGIPRKLPPKVDAPIADFYERNVLIVNINNEGSILINNEKFLKISEVKDVTKLFLDNGGRLGKSGEICDYCEGEKLINSSVHPNKAIISLQSSRKTKHGDYIAVTNEIVRAYNELRNRESRKQFGVNFSVILEKAKKNPNNKTLKTKVTIIKERFPMLFSEAEPLKI